jgi:hypothetical protein
MLRTIKIQLGGEQLPIMITLDLDHVPTISLGDAPSCAPRCGDVKLHYLGEHKLYFWGFNEFIRLDNGRVRWASGGIQRSMPGDAERYRKYKVLSDVEVQEAVKLYGEGLSSAAAPTPTPASPPDVAATRCRKEPKYPRTLAEGIERLRNRPSRPSRPPDMLIRLLELFDQRTLDTYQPIVITNDTIISECYGGEQTKDGAISGLVHRGRGLIEKWKLPYAINDQKQKHRVIIQKRKHRPPIRKHK